MRSGLSIFAALLAAVTVPTNAEAAVRGYTNTNVNMRSGPSTAYPSVTVVPQSSSVAIHGCLSEVNWCDVSFNRGRGWVHGRYVQATYRSERVYVAPEYYHRLGVPSVTYDADRYWDRHYRGQSFYRDRARWREHDWRAPRG
jgi:uncharacterized protein YraI